MKTTQLTQHSQQYFKKPIKMNRIRVFELLSSYILLLIMLMNFVFFGSLLMKLSKLSVDSVFFRGDFATFKARTSLKHGAIQIKSKEKGRHTGASPEALSVLRTGGVRGDLPLFSTKQFQVMRTPESVGQNLSKSTPDIKLILEEFFSLYGSPKEIDEHLWTILVAAFNSKDLDSMPMLDRAKLLCLYRGISELIINLNQLTSWQEK